MPSERPKDGCWTPTSGKRERCNVRLELTGSGAAAWVVSGEVTRGSAVHAFMRRKLNGPGGIALTRNADGSHQLSAPLLFGPYSHERGAAGTLTMRFTSPTRATAVISCARHNINQRIGLRWRGRHYRDLVIELDKIASETFPTSVKYKRKTWSLKKIFDDAGFNTRIVKSNRAISDGDAPWNDGELHLAMQRFRRANPSPWTTHVLLVSAYDDPEAAEGEWVLGIMYDADASLGGPAREGSAVFLAGIRNVISSPSATKEFAREVLMTTAHEIGHTLNLTHSFEKGRSSSPSLMNYPEEHPDGSAAYYRRFKFAFDADELTHMRHHSSMVAEPGAANGMSFWKSNFVRRPGRGNRRSLRARTPWSLSLQLGATEALPGEPLYGQLALRPVNGTARARTTLDWSARDVEIQVRQGREPWRTIRMPIRRCRRAPVRTLSTSKPLVRDVPLIVSTEGEIFPAAGRYLVRAIARLMEGRTAVVVTSRPVELTVKAPRTREEREMRRLFRTPETKRFILLRGGAFRRAAAEAAARAASLQPRRLSARLASMALVESGRSRLPVASEPPGTGTGTVAVVRRPAAALLARGRAARPAAPQGRPDILSGAMERLARRVAMNG